MWLVNVNSIAIMSAHALAMNYLELPAMPSRLKKLLMFLTIIGALATCSVWNTLRVLDRL